MYVQYGGYQHPAGEANLVSFRVDTERSARGYKLKNLVSAHVTGTICARPDDDQYDIAGRVDALQQELLQDGGDFALYHDDGTKTPHKIINDDELNLSGNQIVYFDFPASHNGEYTTGRDFQYVVRAEFLAADSQILDYSETIQHVGTTGPKIQWLENKYYPATYRVEGYRSLQRIRQSGRSLTLGTWMMPPPPILGLPFELEHLRTITRDTPKRYPRGVIAYPVSWEYYFQTPDVFPAMPKGR